MYKLVAAVSLMVFSVGAVASEKAPTIEQLQQELKRQQQLIEQLQAANKLQQERLEMALNAMEKTQEEEQTTVAKKMPSIGGYGELHYNNLSGTNTGDKDAIDFHRFVLFVGHDFSEKTRFFSELELEHSLSGDGKPGEVELEQAYIEHDLSDQHKAKMGLFLMPVGILNETHEPDTFYGVERNNVEKNIIPSTWWEAGLAFNGQFGEGFSYDVALTSGLNIDVGNGKYKIRDGRQKVAKAKASDFATTARLKYTGIQGLELGVTLQRQADVAQSALSDAIDATLFETHAIYQRDGFAVRALYANWNLDQQMNQIKEGAAKQTGFFIEPSYRINDKWGVFARFSEWDNQADSDSLTGIQQTDFGFNYWLQPNAVIKFDYQRQNHDSDSGKELDGINLGVGYSF